MSDLNRQPSDWKSDTLPIELILRWKMCIDINTRVKVWYGNQFHHTWRTVKDSNFQPTALEAAALPIELTER